jgi:outer membrane protein assembly factor BamB
VCNTRQVSSMESVDSMVRFSHADVPTPAVVALHAVNGSEAWIRPGSVGAGVRCSSSRVFVANSSTGTLTALDAASGSISWQHSYGAGGLPLLPTVHDPTGEQ